MASLSAQQLLSLAPLLFTPIFWRFSPASKSTKLWTTIWLAVAATYIAIPDVIKPALSSAKAFALEKPLQAALIAVAIGAPLKYIQRKLRFARINAIKWKYGYDSSNPKTWENMTVEQAKEIELNMAEWEFPRLFQFAWLSDFFRTSTDPGVARAISSSGHFINEDKRIEHQRMQATVHLMTGLMAYPIKTKNSSLVIARINEHHHRYGIKINSDDVLYLVIHFGLAPVPWINRFGYRKLEPFEVHALWVLWREIGVRFGCRYVPKTLEQALEWRKNFETIHRWRDPANEKMAMAMLWQVLYPVPGILKGFVAKVVASILDWDIVYLCQMESLGPSPALREVVFDLFRLCGFFIREFGLPRLSRYQRSPDGPNKDGNVTFPHTPYDTMPWWQEDSLWNRWGPRALFYRMILGCPPPSAEFQSKGVPFEAMGAPHPHARTQSAIEQKVRENAAILEDAEYGYRPAIGFQANRLIGPVDGPEYGIEKNRYPPGTKLTPNNADRFKREYERRGGGFTFDQLEKPEDALQKPPTPPPVNAVVKEQVKAGRKDSFLVGKENGILQPQVLVEG